MSHSKFYGNYGINKKTSHGRFREEERRPLEENKKYYSVDLVQYHSVYFVFRFDWFFTFKKMCRFSLVDLKW